MRASTVGRCSNDQETCSPDRRAYHVEVVSWRRPSAERRVRLVDSEPSPAPAAVLRRIAAEGLLLQDEAEAVLAAVARHDSLGAVAPRGGPLVSRFFGLRDQLPTRCGDPRLERLRAVLDTIFHHHAMQVATSLEFLTFDGRSNQLRRQIEAFSGLGAPAALLEDVYRELRDRP